MRPSVKMIATAAFAVFLMPAFNLYADDAVKPSAANDEKAADSSVPSVPDSASLPAAPAPATPMAAAMPYSAGMNTGFPRVEVFLGYSYLRAVPTLAEGNRLVWLNGGSASIALNLNRYLGIVGDFGGFNDTQLRLQGTNPAVVADSSGTMYTFLAGPRLSFRNHEGVTPFVQALFGGIRASAVTISSNCTDVGCTPLPAENKFAMTAGGGLDVRVHRHLAIRVIQAEYLMTKFADTNTGNSASQNDMRLSAGIVFRFGGHSGPALPPPPPLSYSCSVNPSSVFPGATIAASGTAVSLNPAKTAVYTWTVDGGTVSGTSSTASIDTKGLAPGSYTLKGHVSEGSKAEENADCSAAYVVRAFEPPTVSCSGSPSTVTPDQTSTITAIANSPQNRALTYTYSSTAGSVSGTGPTAILSTVGAATGVITVTCNVADDLGQTASTTTPVTIAAPVVAAKPQTSELCSLNFDRDARRPSRVDNEGKACLDEIALNLQSKSDARLAIVGNAGTGERGAKKLASQRAANTKAYLVKEKGIDASRITVYTGSQNGKTVTTTLIPAGANFDSTGVSPIE
jgi:opacity protein-like surface antigen/outer membrane protein OmpA-like peptidoglycan-associated protein